MKKPHPMPASGASPSGERLIVAALCLMVCAVPLTLPAGVYQPVFSPKWLVLHACAALACLGWLLQTRGGRSARLIPSPLALPAALWMGVALLSAPATTHPLDTGVELLNQGTLLVLMFVVASALDVDRLTPVWWAGALTGLIVSLIGILQYHNLAFLELPSKALPGATFINRNFAAEYLICAIPLSGFLFLRATGRPALLASGLSTALMAVFLVYTRTRSAWLGMAVALLVVGGGIVFRPGLGRPVWDALRSQMDRRRRAWAAGFLGLFLVLSPLPPRFQGVNVSLGVKTGVVTAATSIFQKEEIADASKKERFAFWRGTLGMIADHPLLGVGPGGWKRAYPPYDGGATITTRTFAGFPHNDYLGIAAENGLIGLGVYVWFLIAGFRCVLTVARNAQPLLRTAAPMFAISLLAILGDAFFAFPKDQPHAAMFPFLLFGAAAGSGRTGPSPTLSSPAGAYRRAAFRLVPFLFLLVSLGATELSRRHVMFDWHYPRALSYVDVRQDWAAALEETRSALDFGTFQPSILVLKGYAMQHLERDAEAESAHRQALALAPHLWQAHHCLSVLYARQGRLNDALTHGLAARSLCPGAVIVQYNLGAIYHRMGDHDRAEQTFREVLRADPGDAETRFNVGYLYDIRRQPDSAAVYYRQAVRLEPKMSRAYLFLGHLYFGQGRFREALDNYRSFLGLTPDDAENTPLVRERITQCENRLK